ncbi:MAG TPA: type II toxin-antitoxin system PemK/MazF family toxin [Planctomycetaceae bacterium]
MKPGEIHFADLDAGRRPAIVVSREHLNRGDYVVVVLCTSADFESRSKLANCVPFRAGEFGFTKDCVAQCEAILFMLKARLDPDLTGILDETALRDVIRAIGFMLDADCEPV